MEDFVLSLPLWAEFMEGARFVLVEVCDLGVMEQPGEVWGSGGADIKCVMQCLRLR